VRDHPTSKELVITRVEVVLVEPKVVGEAVKEIGVLENDGTVSSGTTGETRDTAVNVGRRGNLNVTDGQTESSKNLPDGHAGTARLDTLRSTDTANLLVLEAGENVGKKLRGPDSVVVGEHNNVGRRVTDTVSHLETLVGEGNSKNADARRVDTVRELLQGTLHLLLCDNNNLLRFSNEPRKGGLCRELDTGLRRTSSLKLTAEFLSSINGGDNDGNIVLSVV
jgi:hypothetical protein